MGTKRTLASRGLPWAVACAVLAGCAAPRPAVPGALTLYDGQPRAGLRVQVATPDGEGFMTGAVLELPAGPPATGGAVVVRMSAKDRDGDALAMRWQGTWFASLRLVSDRPMDL